MGIAYFVLAIVRLQYLHKIVDFSVKQFVFNAFIPIFLSTGLALLLGYGIFRIMNANGFLLTFIACALMAFAVCLSIILVGLAKSERIYLYERFTQYARKIK